MTVLITGVAGFVGNALAKRLQQEGQNVVGVVRDWPANDYQTLPPHTDQTKVFGDVTDVDFIYRILVEYQVTTVYHLAAQSIVQKCQSNPYEAWKTNVLGTVGVLEAVRRYGKNVRVVSAASDKVFGNAPVPYREDSPLLGIETYPATKVAADLAARSFAKTYGLNVSVVRSANVFGPGDSEGTRLIPRSIKKMLNGEPALLYSGAKRMVREFVYIDDEVDAYLTVAREGKAGEAYNVSGSGPVQIGDLMDLIAELCGGTYTTEDREFLEIPVQYMDASKLEALGWYPKVGLEEGLTRTIKWFRQQGRV